MKKFSWKKILITTIIVYVIYLAIALTTLSCPAVVRYCEAGGNEEIEILASSARTVPLSCAQTCTDEEYTSAYIENIFMRFIIPLIVILAVVFLIPKLKRKR